MEILPAIDVREGKCVRLLQGDYTRQIDYRDDPVAQALQFEQAGANWLHVVDLDGARAGSMKNRSVIEKIAAATNLKVQVGGGIRDERVAADLLGMGVTQVVIGTRALEEPDWFEKLVLDYPCKIVLGLDAREGKISTRGWTKTSAITAAELAEKVNDWPLAAIVYTDIARDGMLTGPNLEATRQLAENCRVPIIASGGVSSLNDIKQLARLPLLGVIVGRALYEGKFTLPEALAVIGQHS